MTEQESHYFFDRNNTTFNSYPLIINLIEEEISHYQNKPEGPDKYEVHLRFLNDKKDKVLKIIEPLGPSRLKFNFYLIYNLLGIFYDLYKTSIYLSIAAWVGVQSICHRKEKASELKHLLQKK
jgi:hypothetical protein